MVSLVLVLAAILASGCASPARRLHDPPGANTRQLTQALRNLSPEVDAAEAERLAETAWRASLELSRRYRAVVPAGYHNFLVNQGKRERGLCYHWAEDVEAALKAESWRTLELHRAVARLGRGGEHSALVVTATGQDFDKGIVLDAWRKSGWLYWETVQRDRYFYPWIRVRVREP
jgi:hypothetical protein